MYIADVIVPVYNEADILEEFFQRVSALELPLHLIFVDNASSDGSVALIESFPDVTLVRHTQNEGYGGSLIDGMRHCVTESIVIIDADCEYRPEIIPQLLEKLETNELVYTSRLMDRHSAAHANMPYVKMLGNQIISTLFNLLFRESTTDLYTGCKAVKARCIEGLNFRLTGFEHVLEFACLLSRRGVSIVDIPIDYHPRKTGKSKMSHVWETVKFLYWLVYLRIVPGRAV